MSGNRTQEVAQRTMPTGPVLRRTGTPSHHSSHSPRHSRLYQDDSEPESTSLQSEPKNERVTLVVGGKRFTINPAIFTKHPETMLGRMFGSTLSPPLTEKGEYEIAKGMSSAVFKHILDYYKTGSMDCPASLPVQDIKEACDYFLIPFNDKVVRTPNLSDFMHEISNDGAKKQFDIYLTKTILPVLAECAQKGERECHLIILMDDDVIDWDTENPPYTGEEIIQRVYSSELCRFSKYFENRDIAKEVLREKGLKKIRFGVEGYPTTKDKVRIKHSTGRKEVLYNYVQRPFICMSWEKEEAKSRHVDFTCVKVKTDINPEAEAATLGASNLPDHDVEPND